VAEEPDVPFYYANVMQAHLGAFDFTIDFGIKKPEAAPNASPETQCRVVMSLSHAKTMLPILARLIAQYEGAFGQIPAPGYDEHAKE
jgi:hypothetical protein